jgi:heavy metal sensor kinase
MVIHSLLQRSLGNEIDDNLRVYSARVHGTLNPEQIPEPLDYEVIHDSLPPVNEFALPGVYVQLVDRSGSVVVKSDNLGEQELPMDASLAERGFAGDVTLETLSAGEGARVRVMVSPLFLHDETLVLQVGQSLGNMDAAMAQVRWAILGGVLVTLLLAGISGWALVRRALQPVERITRTAQNIESGSDLSRRVGYSGPMDEVGRLATTFDHMIERLDGVFESQRHFVADASHDLRGPLTVFRGNIGLLRRNLREEDRLESLKAMEAETARMEGMVDDLLLLAQVESGQIERGEKVSLKEVLNEGLELAVPLAGSRRLAIGRLDELSVRGDAARLRRMLANLIDNAIRYTPEDGTITLSLSRDDGWARIDVADTGEGIASEHLPHVFDRFYRADKSRTKRKGGTGLGLAIVKGIAEHHGGTVSVVSEPGEGSTFTVWLRL